MAMETQSEGICSDERLAISRRNGPAPALNTEQGARVGDGGGGPAMLPRSVRVAQARVRKYSGDATAEQDKRSLPTVDATTADP